MDRRGGETGAGTLKTPSILRCFMQSQCSVFLGPAPTAQARPWKRHAVIDPLVSHLSRAHLQRQLCLPVNAEKPAQHSVLSHET